MRIPQSDVKRGGKCAAFQRLTYCVIVLVVVGCGAGRTVPASVVEAGSLPHGDQAGSKNRKISNSE